MNYYDIAKSYRGTKEISGKKHNPDILKMYSDVGFSWVKDDETAWCAAFVGSILKKAGLPYLKTLAARDYLKYGKKISEPEVGCIVVFWRGKPNGWQGHVGFVYTFDNDYIWCLGGNQSNSVNVTRIPRTRVLGFRMPSIETKKEVTKLVRNNSTKLSLLHSIRAGFTFLFTTLAGIFSLDTLGIVNNVVSELKGFLSTNVIPAALITVIGFWFIMKWIEQKSVKDYKEGRYTPSKMETE